MVHSFSGCDTVSGIYGYSKEKVLKKAVTFNEHGDFESLLSVRTSKDDVIKMGLSFFQHIYGNKERSLETLRFLSYNKMVANIHATGRGLLLVVGVACITQISLAAYHASPLYSVTPQSLYCVVVDVIDTCKDSGIL